MTKKYAEIENGLVTSVRLYEEGRQPEGLVEVTDATGDAGVGCSWDGSKFIMPPKPPKTEKQVRQRRNKLLARSDWTQVPDAPVDHAAWANYRQALRDVTKQSGFPENVIWPEVPQ